jgi:hypothetical protein
MSDRVADSGKRASVPTLPSVGASRLKRITLAALTAFLAINIWTGAPPAALWVGSLVVGRAG